MLSIQRIKFILFLLPIFLLQGCFDYEDVVFNGVENVSIAERANDQIKIKVSVSINNPNTYNIKVKKSNLDLYLNGKYVDKASLYQKVVLKKKTTGIYDVYISANERNIMKAAMGSIGGLLKGSVKIGLKGKVKGSVYGITKSVDVDMEQDINLKEMFK